MGDRILGLNSGAVWICEVDQLSRVGKVKLWWGGGDLTLSPSGKANWIWGPTFLPLDSRGRSEVWVPIGLGHTVRVWLTRKERIYGDDSVEWMSTAIRWGTQENCKGVTLT